MKTKLMTAGMCLLLCLGGCASTWSSASVKPTSETNGQTQEKYAKTKAEDVIITENDITDKPYTVLGDIDVNVNKTTLFSADPTHEQAAEKLRQEGAKIGADAVILVRYGTVGVSLMSWGSLNAKGRAVKFK